MKEYELYFPLRHNDGSPVEEEKLAACKRLLVAEFGGLTLFPQETEGLWRVGRYTYRDQIVIVRVLAEDEKKARSFFAGFRWQLKKELDQAEILIVERDVLTLGELENQPGSA